MRRSVPVRDIVIVLLLFIAWWALRLLLPADGTWGAVRLLGGLVITVLTLWWGLRVWRHVTAQDPTWNTTWNTTGPGDTDR